MIQNKQAQQNQDHETCPWCPTTRGRVHSTSHMWMCVCVCACACVCVPHTSYHTRHSCNSSWQKIERLGSPSPIPETDTCPPQHAHSNTVPYHHTCTQDRPVCMCVCGWVGVGVCVCSERREGKGRTVQERERGALGRQKAFWGSTRCRGSDK